MRTVFPQKRHDKNTHVKRGQLSVAHPVKFSDELDGFLTEHPGTGEQPTRTQKNDTEKRLAR